MCFGLKIASAIEKDKDIVSPAWQKLSWQKQLQKKGIVIETAKFYDSPFTAVKSSMYVNAKLNDVANLVLFVDGCHEQSTVCESIENLGFVDQQNYSQYVVSRFPWPLKKRDMYLKIRTKQEKDTGIVTVKGKSYQEDDLLTKEKSLAYVRIKEMDLQWRLIPQAKGGVMIEHYIHSDPGGVIPAWLFNDAVTSTPLKTLDNIRRLLTLPKYQQRNVPFIFEP